jgi:hypothetical protein
MMNRRIIPAAFSVALACSCVQKQSDGPQPAHRESALAAVTSPDLCYTNFITENFRQSGCDWAKAVKKAQQDGLIRTGMTLPQLKALLGDPSKSREKYWEWYFRSPMHINPAFVVYHTNGVASELQWTTY